ncbi:MAG: hypothetical protein PHN56_01660 [Candidatus Nanoarchaeia archaeon]|nr:hypothetical protein [Candidatus Nanoarchaeia archaeon]
MSINNNDIIDVSVYIEDEERFNNYFNRIFEEKTSLIKPNYANVETERRKNLEMISIYIPLDKKKECSELLEKKHYVISFFGKNYIPSLINMRIKYSDIIITDNKEKISEQFKSKEKNFEFLDELISNIER